MLRKAAVALAVSVGLVALTSAQASAQVFVGGYVAVPPVYGEVGPQPGPGYVWVPRYHRWEYHRFDRPFYRDRDWRRDRDWDRERDWRRDRDRDWGRDRHRDRDR